MTRVLFIVALLLAAPCFAVEPSEMMRDPALEARAREVSKSLRCVVCQNETIDESNAELAHDMRLTVRRRIAAGDSNQEVLHYMVQRYGDFVLLKPRFNSATVLLWLGPLLVLLLGGIAVVRMMRRTRPPGAPLTSDQAAALARLDREP
jgi:cytochrome c-type biogenesis protein CcmH